MCIFNCDSEECGVGVSGSPEMAEFCDVSDPSEMQRYILYSSRGMRKAEEERYKILFTSQWMSCDSVHVGY